MLERIKANIKNENSRIWLVFSILLLAVFSFASQLWFNIREIAIWDTYTYWTLGVESKGNVLSLYTGFRGWVYPMFCYFASQLGKLFGDEVWGLRIVSTIAFSFLFSIVFSSIMSIAFGGGGKTSCRKNCICGVCCGITTFVMFRGLFLYPLTDIYTALICLCTVILFYKLIDQIKLTMVMLLSFVLGILLYAEYNIRTIYLFAALPVMIGVIVIPIRKKQWKKLLLSTCFMVIGIMVMACPQMLLNHKLLDSWSMMVPTDGLFKKQVICGIELSRYATYCGPEGSYPNVQMMFRDTAGHKILDREGFLDAEDVSYLQIIALYFKYPLDIIGAYVRHLINMLYPIFPAQYIYSLNGHKGLYLLLFYTIFYLFIVGLKDMDKNMHKDTSRAKLLLLSVPLIPCLFLLAGAVEIRFFVMMHMYIYAGAYYMLKETFKKIRTEGIVRYILGYIAGFMCYIAGCGYMLSTLKDGVVLISKM